MKTILVTAAILLLMSTRSEAFVFDIWESGMDAKTVIMTAMKADLPLAAEGQDAVGGKFYKPACVPFQDTATRYDYRAKLLGEDAAVTLFLTEKEKKIMKIEISWLKAGELKGVVEKMILESKPVSKRKNLELFAETTVYKVDDENEIDFKSQMGAIYLTYYDLKLIANNAAQGK